MRKKRKSGENRTIHVFIIFGPFCFVFRCIYVGPINDDSSNVIIIIKTMIPRLIRRIVYYLLGEKIAFHYFKIRIVILKFTRKCKKQFQTKVPYKHM